MAVMRGGPHRNPPPGSNGFPVDVSLAVLPQALSSHALQTHDITYPNPGFTQPHLQFFQAWAIVMAHG